MTTSQEEVDEQTVAHEAAGRAEFFDQCRSPRPGERCRSLCLDPPYQITRNFPMIRKSLCTTVVLVLLSLTRIAEADVVVEWNFGDTTVPNVGIGSFTIDGGVTSSFGGSHGFSSNGRALYTTDYAAQGTESGDRGFQFLFDTTGFENLRIDMGTLANGDSSRWYRVDYTVNSGVDWSVVDNVLDLPNGHFTPLFFDTFEFRGIDLGNLVGASNNAGFGIRFRSIFSPSDFTRNGITFAADTAYEPADVFDFAVNYSPSGTFGFDNFLVTGTVAVPEPSSMILVALGTTVAIFRRRKYTLNTKSK